MEKIFELREKERISRLRAFIAEAESQYSGEGLRRDKLPKDLLEDALFLLYRYAKKMEDKKKASVEAANVKEYVQRAISHRMLMELSIMQQYHEVIYLDSLENMTCRRLRGVVGGTNEGDFFLQMANVIYYYFNKYDAKNYSSSNVNRVNHVKDRIIAISKQTIEKENPHPSESLEKQLMRAWMEREDHMAGPPKEEAPQASRSGRDRLFAMKEQLDVSVFGQEQAKEALVMSVYAFLNNGTRHSILFVGPTGSGKTWLMECLAEIPEMKDVKVVHYAATELTKNGFSGDDVKDLIKKVASSPFSSTPKRSIIFVDEIDKLIAYKNYDSGGTDVNEAVVHDLLTAISGNKSNYAVDTNNILFLFGGAFENLDDRYRERQTSHGMGFIDTVSEPEEERHNLRQELIEIGCSRQFLGRINRIVRMETPGREIYRRILTDEKQGILVKKREELVAYDLELYWDDAFVEGIVERMLSTEMGARGAVALVEEQIGPYVFKALVKGAVCMELHAGMFAGAEPMLRMQEALTRVNRRDRRKENCVI